jgi:hypothetical protein
MANLQITIEATEKAAGTKATTAREKSPVSCRSVPRWWFRLLLRPCLFQDGFSSKRSIIEINHKAFKAGFEYFEVST